MACSWCSLMISVPESEEPEGKWPEWLKLICFSNQGYGKNKERKGNKKKDRHRERRRGGILSALLWDLWVRFSRSQKKIWDLGCSHILSCQCSFDRAAAGLAQRQKWRMWHLNWPLNPSLAHSVSTIECDESAADNFSQYSWYSWIDKGTLKTSWEN